MLMNIKCTAVTSIMVNLLFDDKSTKNALIALGDLIEVEYNANGLRKHAQGKVIKISAVGTDPKGWYIIVDGSDDFDSNKVRFSPASILDVEIIRKADTLNVVQTPIGHEGVPFIRIIKGRLQWSRDGVNWHPINIDQRDIIEEAEGTIPMEPCRPAPPPPCKPHKEEYPGIDDSRYDNSDEYDEDTIQESNY